MTHLSSHVTSHLIPASTWRYRFPNGRTASVIPDPHAPLTWELLIDGDPQPYGGLSTDAVRAKLHDLATEN